MSELDTVHFVLLNETDESDHLLFECQVCKMKITEYLASHAGLHGAGKFTVDIATATRKMAGA